MIKNIKIQNLRFSLFLTTIALQISDFLSFNIKIIHRPLFTAFYNSEFVNY